MLSAATKNQGRVFCKPFYTLNEVSLSDDKVVCILFHVALGHLPERGFCAF